MINITEFSCDFAKQPVGHLTQAEYQTTQKDRVECLNSCLVDPLCKAVTFIANDTCRTHTFVGKLQPNEDAEYFRKACPDSVTENSTYPVKYQDAVVTTFDSASCRIGAGLTQCTF